MTGRLSHVKLDRAPGRAAHALLTGVVLVACSSVAGRPATTPGFVGYRWAVGSIGHDGKTTPVPRAYRVFVQFGPDGQFGAHDPVNYHGGNYRVTPGGFTTSGHYVTLVGYAGDDPVILLAQSAISAFDNEVPALAKVSGSTLTVMVGGYVLTAQRDGRPTNL